MKKATKRFIYNQRENLNSDSMWDEAVDWLKNEDGLDDDEITDDNVWDLLYDWDSQNWDDEERELKPFFDNSEYGFICSDDGYNEFIFKNYDEFLESVIFDLTGYGDLRMWDENGHFYVSASVYDCWEVKELTRKGYELYDSWNYGCYGENMSEKEIYRMIMNCNLYSRLPHYMYKTYGSKKYDYEKGEKTA